MKKLLLLALLTGCNTNLVYTSKTVWVHSGRDSSAEIKGADLKGIAPNLDQKTEPSLKVTPK